jgi:hypothetical protein
MSRIPVPEDTPSSSLMTKNQSNANAHVCLAFRSVSPKVFRITDLSNASTRLGLTRLPAATFTKHLDGGLLVQRSQKIPSCGYYFFPCDGWSAFAVGEACSGVGLIVVFQITNWLGRTLAHRTDKLLVKGATSSESQ